VPDDSPVISQPVTPSLPLRVPLEADMAGTTVRADVLGSTDDVLLLQSDADDKALPALGTPVRLRLEWDRQTLNGRLAAHGVAGRFLVTLGERAIRRSRRFSVDLEGIARSSQLYGAVEVRITDLSTGGARVEGIDFAIGSEIDLSFTPPGRPAPVEMRGFVVRRIDDTEVPTVGVAFSLAQPSIDLLSGTPSATPHSQRPDRAA
jgi:PilZ domain